MVCPSVFLWSGVDVLELSLNSPWINLVFLMSSLVEDPMQIGKGVALVTVLDINDNAPVFAMDYETLLCENALAGQVRPRLIFKICPTSLLFVHSHTLPVWLTSCGLLQPLKRASSVPPQRPLCSTNPSTLRIENIDVAVCLRFRSFTRSWLFLTLQAVLKHN